MNLSGIFGQIWTIFVRYFCQKMDYCLVFFSKIGLDLKIVQLRNCPVLVVPRVLIQLQSQSSLINWVETLLFCVSYNEITMTIRFSEVIMSIQTVISEIYYVLNHWNFISNH